MAEVGLKRYKAQLAKAHAEGTVRSNIPKVHGKKASKKSCKDLLQSYVDGYAKLTIAQFKVILDHMCLKKDGTISEYTQKLLEPLYQELRANKIPHRGIVLLVLAKLNKPFFRRRKKEDEEEETPKPQTKTKKSAWVSQPKDPKAEHARLQKKIHDEWKKKTSNAYNKGNATDRIKSVGNGL
jgi:hypothetical protein